MKPQELYQIICGRSYELRREFKRSLDSGLATLVSVLKRIDWELKNLNAYVEGDDSRLYAKYPDPISER